MGRGGLFPSGRPAFEKVGVTLASDVAAYELMKIRILNGGHAAIAYPAGLLDIHFVHEAMADAQIRAFLVKLTRYEVMPTIPPPPNVDLEDYRKLIERRFSNPRLATRSCGSASTDQTASRNSCCQWFATASRRAPTSKVSPSLPRCGAAIAMANPRVGRPYRRTIRGGIGCKPQLGLPKRIRGHFLACGTFLARLATTLPTSPPFRVPCASCGRKAFEPL
jgi:hypothetical protein